MNKKFDVCVLGGCGHIGLPLAVSFADSGLNVLIYDINIEAIELIRQGRIPFMEVNEEPVLHRVLEANRLHFSTDLSAVSEADAVVIVIGTPVDEHLNPRVDLLRKTLLTLIPYISDDQLLILRSTVYPGSTNKFRDWLADAGKACDVAFCPERIVEGKAMEELRSLPQIISSFTESGITRSRELFSKLTEDIIEVQPIEAELAKLYSNNWRYIKFAVANQFYSIANDYDVDFYRVYDAMTHNYPRCQDLPRPGFAAGPCLFKDTMQLSAFYNNDFYLGHTAMLINEGLPNYICKRIKQQFDLKTMTVGILGMSFKAESDDIRESLSFKIKKLFEFESPRVLCSDPYVQLPYLVSEEELIRESDIVILATPHHQYKNLSIPREKKVVDIWNILGNGGKI